jgi:hypothetical protein
MENDTENIIEQEYVCCANNEVISKENVFFHKGNVFDKTKVVFDKQHNQFFKKNDSLTIRYLNILTNQPITASVLFKTLTNKTQIQFELGTSKLLFNDIKVFKKNLNNLDFYNFSKYSTVAFLDKDLMRVNENLPTTFDIFSDKVYSNVIVTEEELKNNNFHFGELSGLWLHSSREDKVLSFKKNNGEGFREFKWNKDLSTKENRFKYGRDSVSYLITSGIKYTFGVELETATGALPNYLEPQFNLICEKDGSVFSDDSNKTQENKYGAEYVTGVLKGDNGLFTLKRILEEIQKRCTINTTCGLHVHIGDIPNSKHFTISLFKLATMVQKDLFKMLPKSRLNNEYCRLLPSNLNFNFNSVKDMFDFNLRVDNYYNILFKSMSGKIPDGRLNKSMNHPRGAKVGYDHGHLRYCWLNFVPLMFNTRNAPNSNTVEFRPHSATLNYLKIKNWILICMVLCKYAEEHMYDLEFFKKDNITLAEIINDSLNSNKASRLIEYVNKRVDKFNNLEEADEYIVESELKLTKKELINI